MQEQNSREETKMTEKPKATNINILNAVRKTLSYEVQRHLPEVTSSNLQQVYNDILNIQPLRNEIVPSLAQRIGLQTVESVAWRNPLARYKKDPMRYGATEEETYVNMCKGKVYDSRESYESAFQQYQSYIMSVFHKVNLKLQYPVTITFDNLRSAFTSEYGIRDMMSAKMESAISAANWDEYLAMKGLIDTGYESEVLPCVTVDKVTDEATAKKLLTEIKSAVGEFQFPEPANNILGATSSSKKVGLIWMTTPRVNAQISVEALAYAFNMDKADIEVSTVIVDKFATEAIQGVLCDVRFFNCRDQFREMSDQRLANILSWNYFYTMVEMISPSPFFPIRVFTTDVVANTGVTITVTGGKYAQGTTVEVPYTVTGGTGTYHPKLVTLEVTDGATSRDTFIIPGTNLLHVGADETGSLTIKGTFRPDTTITGEGTYTKSE